MERYRRGVALVGFSCLAFSFLFSPPPVLQVQSFGFPQRLLSERELLLVLGLSFYPLEQASKHGDLCNEQISDSNERFNLNRGGSMTTQAQGQTRAVAAKKFICGILAGRVQISVLSFFWSSFSLFSWLVDGTA